MARRKKKGAEPPKSPPKDEGFGTLAEQVKAARRDLRAERRSAEARAPSKPATPAPPPEPPKRRMTEQELMAAAFDAVGKEFSGAEKYLGEGYDARDVELVSPEPAAPALAAPDDGVTAEDLVFLEAMTASVRRMEDARSQLVDKDWVGVRWRTEAEIASLDAAELERLELTPAQRDLLRRSRKTPMQVVNVRYFRRGEALGEVEAFVRDCAGRGERFVRVVHGKGRQSEGDPVLKPAVITWCEGPGHRWVRAWAPEIDQSGRFGSLVLELLNRG